MVISHVNGFLYWETGAELTRIILNVIIRNGTVYFVFIAGFLFQYLSVKYEYKNYLRKKLDNVIIPYLIISIPAVLLCILFGDTDSPVWFVPIFSQFNVITKIYFLYVTGAQLFPYFFIPMIVIFYIFAPVFIYIDRHPKWYWLLPFLASNHP